MSARVRRWTGSLLLVAAAALLLFATVVVLRSTRWSGPLGPEYVESHLSIGPIGPGESLEQGFRGFSRDAFFAMSPSPTASPSNMK